MKIGRYDYLSSKFMFTRKNIKEIGGIEELVQELKESKILEHIVLAGKIEENIKRREEIKNLKNQLKKLKSELDKVEKGRRSRKGKIQRKEIALTVVNTRFNIFSRITNFIKNIPDVVKEFFVEGIEQKNVDKSNAEMEDMLQEKYIERREEIKRKYEKEMRELDEKYGKIGNEIEKKYIYESSKTKEAVIGEQVTSLKEELQNINDNQGKDSKIEDLQQQRQNLLKYYKMCFEIKKVDKSEQTGKFLDEIRQLLKSKIDRIEEEAIFKKNKNIQQSVTKKDENCAKHRKRSRIKNSILRVISKKRYIKDTKQRIANYSEQNASSVEDIVDVNEKLEKKHKKNMRLYKECDKKLRVIIPKLETLYEKYKTQIIEYDEIERIITDTSMITAEELDDMLEI